MHQAPVGQHVRPCCLTQLCHHHAMASHHPSKVKRLFPASYRRSSMVWLLLARERGAPCIGSSLRTPSRWSHTPHQILLSGTSMKAFCNVQANQILQSADPTKLSMQAPH